MADIRKIGTNYVQNSRDADRTVIDTGQSQNERITHRVSGGIAQPTAVFTRPRETGTTIYRHQEIPSPDDIGQILLSAG
jgi:hypothetical protein